MFKRLSLSVLNFTFLFIVGMLACVVGLHLATTFWPYIQPFVDALP